ncbi:MAG: class I SAM-dependent methyltransferase [Bacteroidales bacterium]|jgi:2-polyprenyl-3-methyl-5-hydroxy-6-metoxy-1,4-benzoquinol methylase|nr:class I SAM-dependent methyltransferase [Bacteroidales bacterium]
MNNEQNKFYTSISNYYSEIFPYNPKQLQFVKSRVGDLGAKQLLDIGCASGELAFQLTAEDAHVIGIDLNADLLDQAIRKRGAASTPVFQLGNMLELENDFKAEQFDTVLCFGNTLVHLESKALVAQMLKGVLQVLMPGGKFLLQILNYDYILGEQLSELPLIETDNIRFLRQYRFDKNSPKIRFYTELYLKKENQTVVNETSLLALKSEELLDLLRDAGFQHIELFSNFKQDAFGGKHIPLVLSAEKAEAGL